VNCFLSAAGGIDLAPLREFLRSKDLVPIEQSDLAPQGLGLFKATSRALGEADVVVAVIGSSGGNANVFFEIGFAAALGKRILLIVEPTATIPFELQGLAFVRSDLQDKDAVDFGLEQVLASPNDAREEDLTEEPAPKVLGAAADALLERLERLGVSILRRSADLEAIVKEAFEGGGASTVVASRNKDSGADFAVWIDGLQPYFGNPLIVDLVERIDSNRTLSGAVHDAVEHARRANAKAVLVLYLDGPSADYFDKTFQVFDPDVLFFHLRDFISALRARPIVQVLRDAGAARLYDGRQ
jgi:hypothetical protein